MEIKILFFIYRFYKLLVFCLYWYFDLFFWYELNDEVFGNYFFLLNKFFIYCFFFILYVYEGKCLIDFILLNLFCVG